jgi:hypothetical protein
MDELHDAIPVQTIAMQSFALMAFAPTLVPKRNDENRIGGSAQLQLGFSDTSPKWERALVA